MSTNRQCNYREAHLPSVVATLCSYSRQREVRLKTRDEQCAGGPASRVEAGTS